MVQRFAILNALGTVDDLRLGARKRCPGWLLTRSCCRSTLVRGAVVGELGEDRSLFKPSMLTRRGDRGA